MNDKLYDIVKSVCERAGGKMSEKYPVCYFDEERDICLKVDTIDREVAILVSGVKGYEIYSTVKEQLPEDINVIFGFKGAHASGEISTRPLDRETVRRLSVCKKGKSFGFLGTSEAAIFEVR